MIPVEIASSLASLLRLLVPEDAELSPGQALAVPMGYSDHGNLPSGMQVAYTCHLTKEADLQETPRKGQKSNLGYVDPTRFAGQSTVSFSLFLDFPPFPADMPSAGVGRQMLPRRDEGDRHILTWLIAEIRKVPRTSPFNTDSRPLL